MQWCTCFEMDGWHILKMFSRNSVFNSDKNPEWSCSYCFSKKFLLHLKKHGQKGFYKIKFKLTFPFLSGETSSIFGVPLVMECKQLHLTSKTVWNYKVLIKIKFFFAATWMDLEIVILSEVSQTEKDKYHVISLICGI